jgi:hypothetical protein
MLMLRHCPFCQHCNWRTCNKAAHVHHAGPDGLPPTLVFDYPSVAAIADFVQTLLPPAPAPATELQSQAQAATAANDGSPLQTSGSLAICFAFRVPPLACHVTAVRL